MSAHLHGLDALLLAAASVRPDEYAASANGAAVDAREALDLLWIVDIGDVEGAPTSFTVDVKIEDSDTSGGTYAAADDETGADIAIAQQTAANAIVELRDKLHAREKNDAGVTIRPSKRFRRAAMTIAFVAGTSPNVAVSVHALVMRRTLPSAA